MTPRIFFAALHGKMEHERMRIEASRNLHFNSAKWQVLHSGMLDRKGQKTIQKEKFPWEEEYSPSGEKMSFDDIANSIMQAKKDINKPK